MRAWHVLSDCQSFGQGPAFSVSRWLVTLTLWHDDSHLYCSSWWGDTSPHPWSLTTDTWYQHLLKYSSCLTWKYCLFTKHHTARSNLLHLLPQLVTYHCLVRQHPINWSSIIVPVQPSDRTLGRDWSPPMCSAPIQLVTYHCFSPLHLINWSSIVASTPIQLVTYHCFYPLHQINWVPIIASVLCTH